MKLVGILCQDHVYNKRLSEFLMSRSSAAFSVNSFTSMDGFLDYVEKTKFNLLIVEEDLYEELMHSSDGKQISEHFLILKDEILEPVRVSKDSLMICRYISSACVLEYVRILMENTVESGNKVRDGTALYDNCRDRVTAGFDSLVGEEGHKKCKIIGIFSEVHSCGKTSLAVVMSQMLQEKGKTIYLPMDYRNPVFASKERCLVNVILALLREEELKSYDSSAEIRNADEQFNAVLHANMRNFDEISYIPCSAYKEDMLGMEDAHMAMLLDQMKSRSDFVYIVVDFSDGADYKQSLERCDYVLMPSKDDCFSRNYVENFREEWINFQKERNDVDTDREDPFRKFRICQLPGSVRASSPLHYYRELEWSPLAAAAKNLVDEIAD